MTFSFGVIVGICLWAGLQWFQEVSDENKKARENKQIKEWQRKRAEMFRAATTDAERLAAGYRFRAAGWEDAL